MTAFDVYKTYLALKRHFTSDYDFFKYNGKVNASVSAFEGRKDKYYFEKLAKQKDPASYLLANLLENPNVWVGELVSSERSEELFRAWQKRIQSLTYNFRNELGRLEPEFDDNFKLDNGGHPPLLRAYLSKEISLETLIILVHMTGCLWKWDRRMEYDPVWTEVKRKIIKYQPFMKYELPKLKKIVIDYFS